MRDAIVSPVFDPKELERGRVVDSEPMILP
jgi:hypothetical protein